MIAWNQAIDLPDEFAAYRWELDTDVDALEPVDLKSDHVFLDDVVPGEPAHAHSED